MNVYKVLYELIYPDASNDRRTAYVMAKDFSDAVAKVEKNEPGEYERSEVVRVTLLKNSKIYI